MKKRILSNKKAFNRKSVLAVMLVVLTIGTSLFSSCTKEKASAQEGSSSKADLDLNTPDTIIVAMEGTTTEKAAKQAYPNAQYAYITDTANAFIAVKTGKATAFAANLAEFEGAIASGTTGLKIHSDGVIGEVGNVAVGISKVSKLPDAKGLIDNFINEISQNGVLDDMNQRWKVKHDYTMPEIEVPTDPEITITVGTTGLIEPFSFYQHLKSVRQKSNVTKCQERLKKWIRKHLPPWCGKENQLSTGSPKQSSTTNRMWKMPSRKDS